MSNGKPCERHNFPRDICARCKGALEERVRIIILLRTFEYAYKNPTPNARGLWGAIFGLTADENVTSGDVMNLCEHLESLIAGESE